VPRRVPRAAPQGKLAEALKLAEECVDDCAVAWDNVEELSAASQKAGEQPEAKDAVLPKGAEAFIAETRKQIEAAQAAATFDSNTMKAIEAAAASAGSAIKESAGVDEERLARISAALEEAIAVAQECSDDCATEWDTVEELSAAKKHASE
jgi:hypothetical protein